MPSKRIAEVWNVRSLLLVFLLPAMVATAQEYDSNLPTPDGVLGYPLGARVTDHTGMDQKDVSSVT